MLIIIVIIITIIIMIDIIAPTMLETVELPAGVADLAPSLAHVDRDTLTLEKVKLSPLEFSSTNFSTYLYVLLLLVTKVHGVAYTSDNWAIGMDE